MMKIDVVDEEGGSRGNWLRKNNINKRKIHT